MTSSEPMRKRKYAEELKAAHEAATGDHRDQSYALYMGEREDELLGRAVPEIVAVLEAAAEHISCESMHPRDRGHCGDCDACRLLAALEALDALTLVEAVGRAGYYTCDECGQIIEGASYDHDPSCAFFPVEAR